MYLGSVFVWHWELIHKREGKMGYQNGGSTMIGVCEDINYSASKAFGEREAS